MPLNIHHNEMFVFPDNRNSGSYIAVIPTIWSLNDNEWKYFNSNSYRYPKLAASQWVDKQLAEYYGEDRAKLIRSKPQFIRYLQFGCQVSYRQATKKIRGKTYPCFDASYSDYQLNPKHTRLVSKRKRITRLFNKTNRREVEHKLNLELAKIRARLTKSQLDKRVFEFNYDLT